jgi:hypothetical protein
MEKYDNYDPLTNEEVVALSFKVEYLETLLFGIIDVLQSGDVNITDSGKETLEELFNNYKKETDGE